MASAPDELSVLAGLLPGPEGSPVVFIGAYLLKFMEASEQLSKRAFAHVNGARRLCMKTDMGSDRRHTPGGCVSRSVRQDCG
jgi:hypothetical protein